MCCHPSRWRVWLFVCEWENPRKLPQVHCHPLSSMRVKIELLTVLSCARDLGHSYSRAFPVLSIWWERMCTVLSPIETLPATGIESISTLYHLLHSILLCLAMHACEPLAPSCLTITILTLPKLLLNAKIHSCLCVFMKGKDTAPLTSCKYCRSAGLHWSLSVSPSAQFIPSPCYVLCFL